MTSKRHSNDIQMALSRYDAGNRAQRDRALQERVRAGDLGLDSYLVNCRGYRLEELASIRSRFEKEIFGERGEAAGFAGQ